MEPGLNNRSVLITGGSKGIGPACVRAFLDEGARVAIVSRGRANLERAGAQLGQIAMIAADLTQAEQAQRMVLFLASDQATYVTGAVMPVDGGVNPVI